MATQLAETDEAIMEAAMEGVTEAPAKPAAEAAEAAVEPSQAETDARVFGWRPEGEYKGTEPWLPAEEFLALGKEKLPLLQQNNKRLTEANRDLAKKAARLEKMIESVKGFEERAYKRALTELETAHAAAVEDGDNAASIRIRKEMAELQPVAKPEEEPAEHTEADIEAARALFEEWEEVSDWYMVDTAKTAYADLQARLMKSALDWKGGPTAYIEEIERRTERKFAARKPNPTNGGGNRPGSAVAGKTYANLDSQAKQMAQDMVKMGIFENKEAAAKEFLANE